MPLAASNRLFDLMIDLEREWFPDEYEDHINYQWAMLRSARNHLKLGNDVEAEKRLAAIENLTMAAVYQDMMFDVQQQLDQTKERGYGVGHSLATTDESPEDIESKERANIGTGGKATQGEPVAVSHKANSDRSPGAVSSDGSIVQGWVWALIAGGVLIAGTFIVMVARGRSS